MLTATFERWGLNPREQRVASIALIVFLVFVVIGLPVALQSVVASRASDNDDLRSALSAVQTARSQVKERQVAKDAIAGRYKKKAPPLAGGVEQAARSQKLEVSDSTDRPDIPYGKKYVERSTVSHLKKAGMLPIIKFLETIEKSGYPVAVSRLNIRKRSAETDSYDVEVGVSAFDMNEAAPAPAKDGDKKEGDKK
jgi:general secretion pathway protein M